MAELEALKKEKDETAEARKKAEEQIETMRKEHEEKVISLLSLSFLRNPSLSLKGNEHYLKSVHRRLPAVVLSVPFPAQRGNGRRTRHNQCYLKPW